LRIRIRQVYFDPAQTNQLDARFCAYFNDEALTPYFENEVIRRLYTAGDHEHSDYYGVLSWKFQVKHQMDGSQLFQSMENDGFSSSVYSFLERGTRSGRSSAKPNTFFDRFHPNLLAIGDAIVRTLFDEDISQIEAEPIYYNHWIATSDLFDDYCREMLVPAMSLVEHDELLCRLIQEDSGYAMSHSLRPDLAHRLDADSCLKIFGVPYYPHHSFVFERLPSIYFAIRNIHVKYT